MVRKRSRSPQLDLAPPIDLARARKELLLLVQPPIVNPFLNLLVSRLALIEVQSFLNLLESQAFNIELPFYLRNIILHLLQFALFANLKLHLENLFELLLCFKLRSVPI